MHYASPNSYYSVNPCQLSFAEDIENLEKYPWGIEVYEEILRELDLCTGKPDPHQEGKGSYLGLGEEGKPGSSLIYMA